MNEPNNRYRILLGLDEAWLLKSVDLSMESKRVVIALEHRGGHLTCPECGISSHEPIWLQRGPGDTSIRCRLKRSFRHERPAVHVRSAG